VTGAAGFIGLRLVRQLSAESFEARGLDVRPSPTSLDHDRSEMWTQSSLQDLESVSDCVRHVDVVFHLGARVGVKNVLREPLRTLEDNVQGTRNVVMASSEHSKRLIFTSSSEVYGRPTMSPISEDSDRIFGPTSLGRWSYGESKAIGEFYSHAYAQERGLKFTIARLFNTVGPGQTGAYGMVVPRMVRQALNGDPVTVFGDGSQTRCFCHVDDVVRALIDLSESDEAIGATVNVGSQDEISILDLAHRIIDVLGSSSEITFVPYDQAYGQGFAETYRRVPDTSRIESLIGWRPRKTLDDIIVDVAEYLRLNPDA
jgi:UDP-glucose 4-epimerase